MSCSSQYDDTQVSMMILYRVTSTWPSVKAVLNVSAVPEGTWKPSHAPPDVITTNF